MRDSKTVSRRDFMKGVAVTGAATYVGGLANPGKAGSALAKSRVFKVERCPVHDGALRHIGMDTLLTCLSDNGVKLYQTSKSHPWGDSSGIIAADDVVVIKVNCQWKCRGTTNTDVLRGLIHRLLEHPDGFTGEIVIFENGQGQGSFDGDPVAWGSYDGTPIADDVVINAEDFEEGYLTVDYLVGTEFAGYPVSSYLLDPIRDFPTYLIPDTEHVRDGYRQEDNVSYPCFTSAGGNRIELKEGIWNGSTHVPKLKFINLPVLKTHGGSGITGSLKHCYGIVSMDDGSSGIRHYSRCGEQCAKMYTLVRSPDLHIIDCIWVSHEQLSGYPPSATVRCDILLAGNDPVALDYYAAKHVLYPLGGSQQSRHNPDTYSGLIRDLGQAEDWINTHGGSANQGDDNIDLITCSAEVVPAVGIGAAAAGAVLLGHQMLKK